MVSASVPRPVEEVFDFIVEPGLLASYFVTEASGPLVVGAHVTWTFDEGTVVEIDVEAVETNRRVVFRWGDARVTITLAPEGTSATKVTIDDDEHRARWQRMLLGLKARMAYGIDLRA
jgi:uncharacterized protein YndB with AHSA1/START domain